MHILHIKTSQLKKTLHLYRGNIHIFHAIIMFWSNKFCIGIFYMVNLHRFYWNFMILEACDVLFHGAIESWPNLRIIWAFLTYFSDLRFLQCKCGFHDNFVWRFILQNTKACGGRREMMNGLNGIIDVDFYIIIEVG